MRTTYDRQLRILNRELTAMGALCEQAIADSARALAEGDACRAETVPELAAQIDQKEREIEAMCLKLILRQQPVATDLRIVSSALKMITDMERIGKQSSDIAEIVTMANIGDTDDTDDLHSMAMAAIKMVTGSIEAFVKKDADAAREVIEYDDVVDGYFDRIKRTIIDQFSRPDCDSEYAIDMLMIAKYLERIGDHAVNIAEWVLFSITGSREG